MSELRSVSVRMYQVGFGDCFLVSFRYAAPVDGRDQRHMLIDFGSTHRPKGARRDGPSSTRKAAELIATHADELDVVVVTHRHRDHLSGFADRDAQPILERLAPKLVVRPWTDDPDLPEDAIEPARLAIGQALAQRVASLAEGAREDSARGRLAALALDQIPNQRAIDFILELAEGGREPEYLRAGDATAITDLIPGIGVEVLGPPTHEDFPAVLRQRADDPEEFWLTQLHELAALRPEMIDTRRTGPPIAIPPGPVAWIVDKLAHQQLGSLQRIVRTVDAALNNTSLILLIDAGDRRMLFPGDAQIENWSWALEHAPDSARYRELLSQVDLYKVGHHGSRNATPKSLWALWNTPETAQRPMTALMSTRGEVHGKSEATAVPRGPLVEAMIQRMGERFLRTDAEALKAGYLEVRADCQGPATFDPVPPA